MTPYFNPRKPCRRGDVRVRQRESYGVVCTTRVNYYCKPLTGILSCANIFR